MNFSLKNIKELNNLPNSIKYLEINT